jgi:hypothetical protein
VLLPAASERFIMLASNSKLCAHAKIMRKEMIRNLPRDATFAHDEKTTFLSVPDGKVTRVFSSVMSDDEIKFRRKVGEYHALLRFYRDADGGLILPGFWTATMVCDLFVYCSEY